MHRAYWITDVIYLVDLCTVFNPRKNFLYHSHPNENHIEIIYLNLLFNIL